MTRTSTRLTTPTRHAILGEALGGAGVTSDAPRPPVHRGSSAFAGSATIPLHRHSGALSTALQHKPRSTTGTAASTTRAPSACDTPANPLPAAQSPSSFCSTVAGTNVTTSFAQLQRGTPPRADPQNPTWLAREPPRCAFATRSLSILVPIEITFDAAPSACALLTCRTRASSRWPGIPPTHWPHTAPSPAMPCRVAKQAISDPGTRLRPSTATNTRASNGLHEADPQIGRPNYPRQTVARHKRPRSPFGLTS